MDRHLRFRAGRDPKERAENPTESTQHTVVSWEFSWETWETIRESTDNVGGMCFDSYNLYNFVPLPGTDPYRHPERYGITWLSSRWKDYFVLKGENQAGCALEQTELDRVTLGQMRQYVIAALDRVSRPALSDDEFR